MADYPADVVPDGDPYVASPGGKWSKNGESVRQQCGWYETVSVPVEFSSNESAVVAEANEERGYAPGEYSVAVVS